MANKLRGFFVFEAFKNTTNLICVTIRQPTFKRLIPRVHFYSKLFFVFVFFARVILCFKSKGELGHTLQLSLSLHEKLFLFLKTLLFKWQHNVLNGSKCCKFQPVWSAIEVGFEAKWKMFLLWTCKNYKFQLKKKTTHLKHLPNFFTSIYKVDSTERVKKLLNSDLETILNMFCHNLNFLK